ncbi:MAG: hypothetical protein SFV21_08815 [Rhodospirillaceae bacterium]|nr:hypothetical protein [Rhodospirillaceae bacterium]
MTVTVKLSPKYQVVIARAAGLVLAALDAGEFQGVASELSLLELTAEPLRQGRQDVADDCELLLASFPNLSLQPIPRDRDLRGFVWTASWPV